jgi:SAM-dependent methyltransferase
MNIELSDFVCPSCQTGLSTDHATMRCSKCLQSWPIVNNVPHFIDDFPYWGEIPQGTMHEILRNSESKPLDKQLREHPDPKVREASEMILNLDRANWHLLVNLPSESCVLDIGAGCGTISHSLALHFSRVVATEPVLERVQFMKRRFAQNGITNVEVIRTSLWMLPFAPSSFDLIVLNGVLEWVAEGKDGDPAQIQKDALKILLRLLRPGGCLYVGIENRFSPGYFIGYRDPHCGIPFVTVLPRKLAHRYARKKGARGYSNYLYSARGYRRLLKQAGFSEILLYNSLPSYNSPRYLVPLDRSIFKYFEKNFMSPMTHPIKRLLHGFLSAVGLTRYLQYSFTILARK